MKRSLARLSDDDLTCELSAAAVRKRENEAQLLAHLAEIDARGSYPPTFPNTLAFCLGDLRMDEEEAPLRILAARIARRFPAIFHAIADGRLHIEAVVMLGPHLSDETAAELLTAAEHKTESEILRLLALRQLGVAEDGPRPAQA